MCKSARLSGKRAQPLIPVPSPHLQCGRCHETLETWAVDENDRENSRKVLDALLQCLSNKPTEEEAKVLTELLSSLAEPGVEEYWLTTWQLVSTDRREGVMERLDLFRPVATVLETGDATRLDSLSPEQRELAERILSAFR